jgi:hypothetical protein
MISEIYQVVKNKILFPIPHFFVSDIFFKNALLGEANHINMMFISKGDNHI